MLMEHSNMKGPEKIESLETYNLMGGFSRVISQKILAT